MNFLESFSAEQRSVFLGAAETLTLDRGEYLLRRGEPGGDIYQLEEGALEVVDTRSTPEVIVATLGQIYAASENETSLRAAVQRDVDPHTGERVFKPATVASLLVFFVFALQCMSTIVVMGRETNSWRWPAFAFGYLFALAYGASFLTHRVVSALTGA